MENLAMQRRLYDKYIVAFGETYAYINGLSDGWRLTWNLTRKHNSDRSRAPNKDGVDDGNNSDAVQADIS
jgi:hypothetical protein